MLARKLAPVIALGAIAIAYVLVRPLLLERVPHLVIIEFPVGMILIWTMIAPALRRTRQERPAPVAPWRRHVQVVRTLPDPALRPYLVALQRWLETGQDHVAAARVIARARSRDDRERTTLAASIEPTLAGVTNRRKRDALLAQHTETGD